MLGKHPTRGNWICNGLFALSLTKQCSIDPQTSLIRTLDYSNYQINYVHSICGVHQIELTSLPIENILLHLSEYSVSEWLELIIW